MEAHEKTFSGDYFCQWYLKEGMAKISFVMKHLELSWLDDRIVGFTDLYMHYINAALSQNDEELLMENLFAVPEQMQYEFTEFGYLRTEAASAQDFSGEQGVLELESSVYMKSEPIKHGCSSFQYLIESEHFDRTLVF